MDFIICRHFKISQV